MMRTAFRAGLLALACLALPTAVCAQDLTPDQVRAIVVDEITKDMAPGEMKVTLEAGTEMAQAAGPPAAIVVPDQEEGPAPVIVVEAETKVITIPWGDYLVRLIDQLSETVLQVLGVAIATLSTIAIAKTPAWLRAWLEPILLTGRVDQLFINSARTAVGKVKGAMVGKTATIEIANDLVRETVSLALRNGADKVIEFAGAGIQSLADKALARLVELGQIPSEYTAADAWNATRMAVKGHSGLPASTDS